MSDFKWEKFVEPDFRDGSRTDGTAKKPGMLLKHQNGDVVLVGQINASGGICACCRYRQSDVEIKEYAMIDFGGVELAEACED